MTTIRNRRLASGAIRDRSTTPPGDWEAPAPLDWGILSEAERAAAGRTAQASKPVEPRRRRSALPGWLRAILFLPATEAPMAHRDPRLADLDRTMAHRGATRPGLHTVAGSLDRVAAEPRRRILAGEQRRREAGAVLALLVAAILISVAGPIPGLGSSADPTPIYIMIGDNGSNGDYTEAPSIRPLVPVGTEAQDATFLPPPTKAPTKKPAAAPARVRSYVALGDSLTAWPSYNPWPSRLDKSDTLLRLLKNAGVPGNTTAQMRARINTDVFPYKPDVLFVLGGTNDLGYGYSESSIIANLRAIVVAAKARKMVVVLVYVPPDSYTSMAPKIKSLNQAIWNLAVSQNVHIADIWTPLATSNGTINSKYTSDGLHFSDLGCQVVSNAIWARMKRLGM
jgi:lysophospholipase L1-like esterase